MTLTLTDLPGQDQEIARLLARGKSNQEIADELLLAYSTVANRISWMYRQVGISGRVQLGIWVLRQEPELISR